MIFPRTREELDARDRMLASLQPARPGHENFRDPEVKAAHNLLQLSDYN